MPLLQSDIKPRRLAAELTPGQFADRAGCSRAYINQLEAGTRQASEKKLTELEMVFTNIDAEQKMLKGLYGKVPKGRRKISA